MAGKEKIVVDASVVTKWFSLEEDSAEALQYKESHVEGGVELIAPALLLYEVANALNYKPDFTEEDLKESMRALEDLSISIKLPTKDIMERAIIIARKYGISIHDSSYIALAESLNARMVTSDKRLLEKMGDHPLVHLLGNPKKNPAERQ
jgi:predicted nucleic acid-binding protein